MVILSEARLVHVGPPPGSTGVGDYAQDFLAAVQPHVGQIVPVRTGAPGEDGIRDILRTRRLLRRLVQEASAPPTIVHVELSGGAVGPWWATRRLRSATLTATVHDPPWAVWWPWRTRGVARHFVVLHLIHLPTQWLSQWLEARLTRGDLMFALTTAGVMAAERAMPRARVVKAIHPLPIRPDIAPAESRPRAVGVFGYAYRDKGGARIREVRELLDPSIEIVVAGRGTEDLPATPGIRALGSVDGAAEDAFFGSVQAVLVGHVERRSYGRVAHPASGVVNRALSYQTPIVRVRDTIDEFGPGMIEAGPEIAEIATAIETLLDDPAALRDAAMQARERRARTTAERVAEPFVSAWTELLR